MRFGGIFDYAGKAERLSEVEALVSKADLWDDQERAQTLLKERTLLQTVIERVDKLNGLIEDTEVLIELGESEDDDSVTEEVEASLEKASSDMDRLEFQRMLGGENDAANAILTVNAGAGGTDSQDWAEMLLRMYLRFCERQGWTVEIFDRQSGDEAGIKSVTLSVDGEYAYGMLRSEVGVHRLVRISPFDASSRRHTSFAACYVYPDIGDDIEVDIRDADLRIDTFRASGAGGQHVNKTSSAIRLTHLPTGIVVQCQAERSQHKNKATALKMLKARLYDLERQAREDEKQALEDAKQEIAFGSQVRSYVLHPYRLVKDLRTSHETGNVDAVLDGDLEPFVTSYLMNHPST